MKKYMIIFFSFIILLTACDKIFLDVEGKDADLQGKWQMTPVDTIYWGFQHNLFQCQLFDTYNDTTYQSYGYYTLYGDSIKLKLLRQYSQFSLDFLGWDTIPGESHKDTIMKVFDIDLLNNKKLILSSGSEKLTLNKF